MSARMKDALRMAAIAIDGLEVIQSLTQVGGPSATAALAAIDKIVSALRDGFDGKTAPEIVAHEIKALHATLAADDAEADEIIRKRLDTADEGFDP